MLVLVDGAHALGQIDVDVATLGADFFVANCHKWLCAPRGSAILWVARERQPLIRPLVISHGVGEGFTSDFIWDGECPLFRYPMVPLLLALLRRISGHVTATARSRVSTVASPVYTCSLGAVQVESPLSVQVAVTTPHTLVSGLLCDGGTSHARRPFAPTAARSCRKRCTC